MKKHKHYISLPKEEYEELMNVSEGKETPTVEKLRKENQDLFDSFMRLSKKYKDDVDLFEKRIEFLETYNKQLLNKLLLHQSSRWYQFWK